MTKKTESRRDRFLSDLSRSFSVSPPGLGDIVAGFHREMERGLEGKESSLRMLPAFVGRPSGTEQGKFLALDLGGTNCRVLEVELDGRGGASVTAAGRFVIPPSIMHGPGGLLFDFLAGAVYSFMREQTLEMRRPRGIAFAFSFPVEQRSLASGNLIRWTKDFTASGVEGGDVVALLARALETRGLSFLHVSALLNDTVGTLLAGSYADPACDLGVILGTGTNASYPEQVARIRKIDGAEAAGEMIVNLEWGNFDRLETNRYDDLLDEGSPNPGRQRLEKMVSGMYLGELARLAALDMVEAGLLFPGAGGSLFSQPNGLATGDLPLLARGDPACLGALGLAGASADDLDALRRIVQLVAGRSACIAGAAIAAVLTWMDPDVRRGHTVSVDGSLFEKFPGYREGIADTLRELFGERAAWIRLVLVKDGSGIGSAIAGAVAALAAPAGS